MSIYESKSMFLFFAWRARLFVSFLIASRQGSINLRLLRLASRNLASIFIILHKETSLIKSKLPLRTCVS